MRYPLIPLLLLSLLLLFIGCTSAPGQPQPVSAPEWTAKGYDLFNLGKNQEAVDAFDRAIALDPGNKYAWNGKANALAQLGKNTEAIEDFDRALSLDVNYTHAWSGKGNALFNLGRPEDAITAFDRAISLDQNNTYAWSGKGNVLFNLGRGEEALQAFDRALAADRSNQWAWIGRGQVLVSTGKAEEALAAFGEALSMNPKNVHAWTGKGDALLSLGKVLEGREAYEEALSINPDYPWAKSGRENALRTLEGGMGAPQPGSTGPPASPAAQAQVERGNSLINQGKFSEAEAAFKEAISLDPDYIEGWMGKGGALLRQGRPQEALAAFEMALSIDANYTHAWNGKANALFGMGSTEAALTAFNRALSCDSRNQWAWIGKGNALLSQRMVQEASEAYETALSIDPQNAQAWTGKGNALFTENRTAEALTAFDKALSLDAKSSQAWTGKGNALLAQGQLQESQAAFEKALVLDPNNRYAQSGLEIVKNQIRASRTAPAPPTSQPTAASVPGQDALAAQFGLTTYHVRELTRPALQTPLSITAAPDGTIYILHRDGSVSLVDPVSGKILRRTVLNRSDPVMQKFSESNGMDSTVSPDGTEYQALWSKGTIVHIGKDGSQRTVVSGLNINDPIYLDLGPDGMLYFSERVYTFARVNPDGGPVTPIDFIRNVQGESLCLKDFAFEPSGDVILVSHTTGTVVRASFPEERLHVLVPGGMNSPALAVSPGGEIVAGQTADYPLEPSRIVQLEEDGSTKVLASVPGQIRGLAYGREGSLYGTSYTWNPAERTDEFWLYRLEKDGSIRILIDQKSGPNAYRLSMLAADPVTGDLIGFDTKSGRLLRFLASGEPASSVDLPTQYPLFSGYAAVDPEGRILLLVVAEEGHLTGPSVKRELYSISPDGSSKLVADLSYLKGCCTAEALAAGPDGTAYSILSPEFELIRAHEDGKKEVLGDRLPVDPLGIVVGGDGRIVFSSADGIFELDPAG